MRLAQPPGVRSCRDGGKWEVCRNERGANYWMGEVEALKAALTEVEFALSQQELRQKMAAAMEGELTYGSGAEFDVEQMASAPDVLEIRLDTRTGDNDQTMMIRLYFSEPEELPGRLVALMLAWKRPGPIGVDLQTKQAQVASRRLNEHGKWISNGKGNA